MDTFRHKKALWRQMQMNAIKCHLAMWNTPQGHEMGISDDLGVPENAWFMSGKNPSFEMDDLGVPLFQETSMWITLWRGTFLK